MTSSARVYELPGTERPFEVRPSLARLVEAVRGAGGRAILVGGAVRDHLLGHDPKDVDVEIYGVALEPTERALAAIGSVHAVGRSFGVLKVHVATDGDEDVIDVALPRRESKVGRGHRGFVVESDPDMPFAEAAARRDFTMNALGIDLATGELLDPWGGVRDLENGVLRHVSPAFDEDPLRVLRACQFASRFQLSIAEETLERCRALEPELFTLPTERLWEEMKKLLLKAPWPSVGLSALVDTRAIALFPELAALRGCPQEAEWHPEGDVWIHTLLVTDEAARIVREEGLSEKEALLCLLGALCHDLGKPPTTAFEEGRIRSKNHEAEGEAPTRAFLSRIGAPNEVIEAVIPVVRDHLKPFQLYRERESVSDSALRRLALRVPIPRLVWVARADFRGRTTGEALRGVDAAGEWLLAEAARLKVDEEAPKPILLGRHLLARGLRPGPHLGRLLNACFEAQLEGAFSDEESAERWLDGHLGELLEQEGLAP